MVADCVQGIMGYPMYLIVTVFVLFTYSWFNDIAPVMFDRSPGHSLLNPFDINQLRDFNLFFILVGILGAVINRIGWSGGMAFSTAAKNAHEQKMAGVLSSWRNGFHYSMIVILAILGFAFLNGDRFQPGEKGAIACRTDLAVKAVDDVVKGEKLAPVRREVIDYLKTGTVTPELQAMLDKTEAVKAQEKLAREKIQYVAQTDAGKSAAVPAAVAPNVSEEKQKAREARVQVAKDAIRSADSSASQTFGTIFGQMRVPMALRYLLPIGILGIFCALCIMGMMSCDISYMHSWGSILVQDIILPIRGKPFSPERHLSLLRWMIVFVALFAFFFSLFFGQMDFIIMFFTITGAIWLGGSGPCLVGGLYWKRGTTAGAWTALLVGSGLAVTSIIVQKTWIGTIYPWLHEAQLVDTVATWLAFASAPFEPIIKWRMSSEKFPINSMELYGINLLLSIGSYIVVSLLTCREPFNMDRMLHRGKYQVEGEILVKEKLTFRNVLTKLIGIDSQYSRGDKILAWSVFIWSFGWAFLCAFVGVAVWNFISPWGNDGWSLWFFINQFVIAFIIGLVSTVWFTIGGVIDLRRMFKALAAEKQNVLDDGRVIGHVSAADVDLVETVEHVIIPEAHCQEDVPLEKTEAGKDRTGRP
jgi:SSS family solute:Na+ symporter